MDKTCSPIAKVSQEEQVNTCREGAGEMFVTDGTGAQKKTDGSERRRRQTALRREEGDFRDWGLEGKKRGCGAKKNVHPGIGPGLREAMSMRQERYDTYEGGKKRSAAFA